MLAVPRNRLKVIGTFPFYNNSRHIYKHRVNSKHRELKSSILPNERLGLFPPKIKYSIFWELFFLLFSTKEFAWNVWGILNCSEQSKSCLMHFRGWARWQKKIANIVILIRKTVFKESELGVSWWFFQATSRILFGSGWDNKGNNKPEKAPRPTTTKTNKQIPQQNKNKPLNQATKPPRTTTKQQQTQQTWSLLVMAFSTVLMFPFAVGMIPQGRTGSSSSLSSAWVRD